MDLDRWRDNCPGRLGCLIEEFLYFCTMKLFISLMKKVLSYFLIIYLLILTLMPCMDKEVHSGAGIHEMINLGHQGSQDDHQDCCSPLCTCSCCNLPFETTKTFIIEQTYSLPRPIVCAYNPQIESYYHFSIWEPPKA